MKKLILKLFFVIIVNFIWIITEIYLYGFYVGRVRIWKEFLDKYTGVFTALMAIITYIFVYIIYKIKPIEKEIHKKLYWRVSLILIIVEFCVFYIFEFFVYQ